jgi:thiol-disulfide isomerase/thioredoxin
MFLQRLLISLAIVGLSAGGLAAVRHLHRRRVNRSMNLLSAVAGLPTILYFRSDACAPCVTQSHYLQLLEKESRGQLAVRRVDVEADYELAAHYGVFTLPTTLVLDGRGEVRHINYGLTVAAKLAQQLESVA